MQAQRNQAKAVTRSQSPQTLAERERVEIDIYVKSLLSSKEASLDFLRRNGVITRTGRLTKHYRD